MTDGPGTTPRTTYLLIDGENIDATLGTNVLKHRPGPDDRPRWDAILRSIGSHFDQPVIGLFFLNASSGFLPMSFVQALTAMDYRVIPLSGPEGVKVVDVGVQRTLEAILSREADVVVASHDADFQPQVRALVEAGGRRVAMLGFTEFFSQQYSELRYQGLEFLDLEHDAGAFLNRLPRLRIIDVDEFRPEEFL